MMRKPSKTAGQSRALLVFFLAHVGERFSTVQLRDELRIENITARISELRQRGWRIVSDGFGRDGTQLYALVSPIKGQPQMKLVGLTLKHVDGDEPCVRVHQEERGSPKAIPAAAKADLDRGVLAVYQEWVAEHQDEGGGGTPGGSVQAQAGYAEDLAWVEEMLATAESA